jgi:hypothetical protein
MITAQPTFSHQSSEKENTMSVRCKMKVDEVWISKGTDGAISQERVKLSAVYGDTNENKEWSKGTPSANFEIYINNQAAMGKLSQGHEFYVDFTPVPKNT